MSRKRSATKDDLLQLTCDWQGCMLAFACIEDFLLHIDSHLKPFCKECNDSNGNADELVCQWSDCQHDTIFCSMEDLTRHLKYHAFHQKLKRNGLSIMSAWKNGRERKRKRGAGGGGGGGKNGDNEEINEGGNADNDDCIEGGSVVNSYNFSGINDSFGAGASNSNDNNGNSLFSLTLNRNKNLDTHNNNNNNNNNNTCNNNISTTHPNNNKNLCKLDNNNHNLIPDLPHPFICNWNNCQTEFNCAVLYYTHVSNHADNLTTSKTYACQWTDCSSKGIKTLHKLKCHLRTHSQEKVVACPTCGALYANSTKFLDHILRQADFNSQKYRCSYCRKLFATERLLRNHMRQHVNHYKCPFCAMTCPTPSSLRTHIHYRHSEDRPFHCDLCSFKAKAAVDLRKHSEVHEEGAWLECEESGCTFRARFSCDLALHFKNKHQGRPGSRYKCHMCGSCFSRGAFLTRHLKHKHHLVEPSGHVRLRYKLHEDGFYRLQEFRYESSELREQEVLVVAGREEGVEEEEANGGDEEEGANGGDEEVGANGGDEEVGANGGDEEGGVDDGDRGGLGGVNALPDDNSTDMLQGNTFFSVSLLQ